MTERIHASYCVANRGGVCQCQTFQQTRAETRDGGEMSKERLHEDDESQPQKGAKQKGLPGVHENAKTYPDVDMAMQHLAELLDQKNQVEADFEEHRDRVMTLLKKHKVPGCSYVAHGVMVGEKVADAKLYVKKLTAPKKKDAKTEAA